MLVCGIALIVAKGVFASNTDCTPVVTFADGKTPARIVHVATSGSDTEGDGSVEKPFRTLGKAVAYARPGTAIRLRAGTYAGGIFLTDMSGSAEEPLWIGGFPGETKPVLTGGGTGLHLTRGRYVIIENLEISGASGNGLNCDDGGDYANPEATRFVLFRNLTIHDIGGDGNQDGLKLSGLNDYWVLDCHFARCGGAGGGSGIDHVGCHRGLIARCQFRDLSGNAVQCKGGSEDIEIRGSQFIAAGQRSVNIGGSTGFTFFRPPLSRTDPNFEAKNIRVFANVFQNCEAPLAFVGCVDCLAAHNTIVNPQRWILRILQETTSTSAYAFLPASNSRFINNLVYFNTSQLRTHVNLGPNTSPFTFQFSHNLWYAHNDPSHSTPQLPVVESGGIVGRDPLLANPSSEDYTLSSTSPAAGRGAHLSEAPVDFLGHCYADTPSIGAFEANPKPSAALDSDQDGLPDSWEDANGLNKLDGADATADADGDGQSNLGEYVVGTDPRNPLSDLRMTLSALATEMLSIRFSTAVDRYYALESTDDISANQWQVELEIEGDGKELTLSLGDSLLRSRFFRLRVALTGW